MSGKSIATIYFYLISAISLVLIIIGIFNTVNLVINSTQYDQYPLRYASPGCDDYPAQYKMAPIPVGDSVMATPSALELQKQKDSCAKQQAFDRKQHRLDDIKNAITFSLVGVLLFLVHFPQARKQSRD